MKKDNGCALRRTPTATRLPKWSDGAGDARSCWSENLDEEPDAGNTARRRQRRRNARNRSKQMNKRKQKHDDDRKHASDDDGSGEEQSKTMTTGQQHGEPIRRHPAEPERQHSRKLSKRRRAEPDSAGGTHPEGDEQENAPSIPQERGARRGRQAYNTPVLSVLSRLSDQSRPPSMGGWGCVPAREHSCIGQDNAPYSAR